MKNTEMTCHVLSLGANADEPARAVPGLQNYFRFAGLDGLEGFSTPEEGGNLSISEVIAQKDGKVIFTERAFSDCSSVLEPIQEKVTFFGLEPNYQIVTRSQKDAMGPVSLAELIAKYRFSAHVLKCDLEGLDGSFCMSFLENVPELDLLQMELRFEEFYEGEMPLHEVLARMRLHGFEVISCKTEDWVPAIGRDGVFGSMPSTDGVTAYADVIFARSAVLNAKQFGGIQSDRATRFVLGLIWLGLYRLAARQLAYFADQIPDEMRALLSEKTLSYSRRRHFKRVIKRLLFPFILLRRRFLSHNRFLQHVITE